MNKYTRNDIVSLIFLILSICLIIFTAQMQNKKITELNEEMIELKSVSDLQTDFIRQQDKFNQGMLKNAELVQDNLKDLYTEQLINGD